MARVSTSTAGYEKFGVVWYYGDEDGGECFRSAALYEPRHEDDPYILKLRREPGHKVVRTFKLEAHLAEALAKAWCAGPQGEG